MESIEQRPSLLILGAGGHGAVVKECALATGEYSQIDFLDDNATLSIGGFDDVEKFKDEYEYAFVSIGNNPFRYELVEKLEKIGYKIATIIHPTAYVSESAYIEKGCIIEPKAVVNSGAIVKKASIISVGAIVDHDAVIEEGCHINVGAICKSGSRVSAGSKLEAGQIVLGY